MKTLLLSFLSCFLFAASASAQETQLLPEETGESELESQPESEVEKRAPDDVSLEDELSLEDPTGAPFPNDPALSSSPPRVDGALSKNSPTPHTGESFAEENDDDALHATVLPGLIGIAAGAVVPTTVAAIGAVAIVVTLAQNDGWSGCGTLIFASACFAAGVITVGPAGVVGVTMGTGSSAYLRDRTWVPTLAGAATGATFLGVAATALVVVASNLSSFRGEFQGFTAVLIPTVLLVLSAPATLAVSTLVDYIFYNEIAIAPTATPEAELSHVVDRQRRVSLSPRSVPLRY